MAATPNYGFVYPDNLGSTGAWGALLNNLFVAVDAALKAVENVASAALARAGGTLTGHLFMKTASVTRSALGSISGAVAIDTTAGQYFSATVGGALSPSLTGAQAGTVAQAIILSLTNGGAFAISWPASVKWPSGTAPTLTVAGTDLIGLLTDDNGATWKGFVLGKDVR